MMPCTRCASCTCTGQVGHYIYSGCISTASVLDGGRVRGGGGTLSGINHRLHERRGAHLSGLALVTLLRGDAAAAAIERAANERAEHKAIHTHPPRWRRRAVCTNQVCACVRQAHTPRYTRTTDVALVGTQASTLAGARTHLLVHTARRRPCRNRRRGRASVARAARSLAARSLAACSLAARSSAAAAAASPRWSATSTRPRRRATLMEDVDDARECAPR